ncbi:class I SAM-dependent methyltransferase [Marilutibacter alkalisoli]|uniref:class I SAM-dependent methyltransferase n=1 Tax=Marilutibacter alkalisoli TaxID=2591633 RepID=UPI001423647D|nr:class I SAM-dependent methyltransferase [Lysobacter alkalisoli]
MDKHDLPDPRLTNPRQQVWSSYWKQGALHSLTGSFDGSYGGAIRTFWEGEFAALQEDDRVLDIGTGNGPLPALLCELRHDTGMPRVDAIDLASVAPGWLQSSPPSCRGKIHFHSHVSAEALPFDDGTFSLGISQYGLEYSQLDRSIAELGRVIRPGGRIALIMHHADSRLAAVAREEIRLIGTLLGPDGLMQAAGKLFPYLDLAAQGQHERLAADPMASQARTGFNVAMRSLGALAEQSPYPDVLLEVQEAVARRVDALLQRHLTLDSALHAHTEHVRALQDSAFRSDELCMHALTKAGISNLMQQLQACGFGAIDIAPIHHQSLLVGRTLLARRD